MEQGKALSEFEVPSSGILSHFTNDQVAAQLMTMGVLPGEKIELVRKAPFGAAWYLKVNGRAIAVRKEEAQCIILK